MALNRCFKFNIKNVEDKFMENIRIYKCIICKNEFWADEIDYGLNEEIKHMRSKDNEQSRMIILFSHWNRARSILENNKSICFNCYCKERMNKKSKYIKYGHSYFYPEENKNKTNKNININKYCSIYFIQNKDNKMIKIGKANNIQSRLSSLSCGSASELLLIGKIYPAIQKDESDYHKRFKDYRIRGEWFDGYILDILKNDDRIEWIENI